MAGTLGDMKARIARELARGSSLTQQIADAINDAIEIYKPERFTFNEMRPGTPVTFNTVIGQPYYTADGQAIFQIDYLQINIGNTWVDLYRTFAEEIKLLNDTGSSMGQPSSYAWEGEAILLHPVPSGIYPIRYAGIFSYPAPATDNEVGNRWMIDAERLIRSRAKYEIAKHVTRNPTMVADMNPENPGGAAYDAFIELKRKTNRIKATGRVRPMQF